MTYEHFKQHWHRECFKDGVLTIPDGVTELYEDTLSHIGHIEEISKVVLPADGKMTINGEAFQGCKNLETIENFPPTYHWQEEFVDEETGDTVLLDREYIHVCEEAFTGCYALFKDRQHIDEDGYICIEIDDKVYPVGYSESRKQTFAKEMTTFIATMYMASEEKNKSDFSFRKTICRYGNSYEYLFENGALYNVTNGTWVLYLPEYSNQHLIIPAWVMAPCCHFMTGGSFLKLFCKIKSLKLLGFTDIDDLCHEHFDLLEEIQFSDKHSLIRSGTFRYCPNLSTITFLNPECIIERDAFKGCSKLMSLVGLEPNYAIRGGGIFHNDRLLTALNDDIHYPDGAEWLDDISLNPTALYLPSSIKHIEGQYYDDWNWNYEWAPVYLRTKRIVVSKGSKEYFVKLFYEDYGEDTIEWTDSCNRDHDTDNIIDYLNGIIEEQ